MADVRFSFGLLVLLTAVFGVYGIRAVVWGRARHWRVEKDGGSAFVGKSFMEIGYWLLEPVVALLHRAGVTPNAVTTFALLPGIGAGVAAAFGFFAFASALATAACFCDIVDGLLARRSGLHSSAGEAYDAVVDRYGEFFFIGGLVIYYRFSVVLCAISLFALFGSFMVSYTSAKAEGFRVRPPRGSMRRAERAIYLLFGAGLTPAATALVGDDASIVFRQAPLLFAVALVAVASNASAIWRSAMIMRQLRERDAQRAGAGAEPAAAVAADPIGPELHELDKPSRFV